MDNQPQPNQQPVQQQPQYQPQPQYNQQPVQPSQPAAAKPGKALSIVGFIMAFVGLGLVGLILSIISVIKAKKAGLKNGLAIAGIILNSLSIIVASILISFTLIAYNGVTAKAQTSKASSNALTMESCAEIYYMYNDEYPDEASDFTEAGSSCSISLTDTLNGSNGLDSVSYQYSGSYGSADGGKISYWDFTTGKLSSSVLYIGSASSYSDFSSIE